MVPGSPQARVVVERPSDGTRLPQGGDGPGRLGPGRVRCQHAAGKPPGHRGSGRHDGPGARARPSPPFALTILDAR